MIDKFVNWIKKNRISIGITVAALFVAFLPLFSVNCIKGHDIDYHLLRIEALKEGILAGHPFLKVNMLFFGGRGYASSLFYPDFLLYIPAILRCLHVSINASYHIFVAICIILSFVAMYYSVRMILSESDGIQGILPANSIHFTALMAAIIYTLSQYHLDDIYTRAAVGEYTAMIFIPILIYSLYDMISMRMKRPLLMLAGFTGLVLCHTTSTFFMLGVYVLAFIFSIPAFLKDVMSEKRKEANILPRIIVLIITAVGVIGVTAFYWMPVLEQFSFAKFNTDAGGFDMNYEKLLIKDVFKNVNPALGSMLPVLCMTRLFISQDAKWNSKSKGRAGALGFADICLLYGIIFTLGTTGLVPWSRLQNRLGFIQFPWRLFIVATPMLCVASAIYIGIVTVRLTAILNRNLIKRAVAGISVVITAMMILSGVSNLSRVDEGYYSYSDDYYEYEKYTGSVIGGEWLPKTVTNRKNLLKNCNKVVFDDNTKANVSRKANALMFETSSDKAYVDVPFIFYKGYAAKTKSGVKLAVMGDGYNGNVRVYLNGAHGKVKVYYAGTFIQHISTIISIIFSLLIIIYALARKKGEVSE